MNTTEQTLFNCIYAQVCGQAYRYHLETGGHIEYREIARMARHMTQAALKELTPDDPI